MTSYKYVVCKYGTPKIVCDLKRDAVELAEKLLDMDDKEIERSIREVMWIPEDI